MVGQQEDSLSTMGGTHLGRAEHSPLSSEPAVGQRPENVSEGGSIPGRKEVSHVLKKDPLRSNLANDAVDGWPKPAFVGLGCDLAGDGHGLARETGDDAANPTPGGAVQSLEITPHRRWLKRPIFHARRQDFAGSDFPLSEQDAASASKSESDAEVEPSASRAEGDVVRM